MMEVTVYDMSAYDTVLNIMLAVSTLYAVVVLIVKVCRAIHSYITTPDGKWFNYEDPIQSPIKAFTPYGFNIFFDILIMAIFVLGTVAFLLVWPAILSIGAVLLIVKYSRKRYQRKQDFIRMLKGEELSK